MTPGRPNGKHGHPDHFPAGGAERQGGFLVQLGGLQEDFAAQRGDDGQDHDGQHNSSGQDGLARGRCGALENRQPAHVVGQPVVGRRDFLGEEGGAPGAVDHGGDRGQQVDHVAQAGGELARGEVRDEQRDADRDRRRDHEGDDGRNEGADDDRPDVGEKAFAALDLVRGGHKGGECLDQEKERYSEEHGQDQAPSGQCGCGKDLISGAACAPGRGQGGGGHFTILQILGYFGQTRRFPAPVWPSVTAGPGQGTRIRLVFPLCLSGLGIPRT